MTSKFERSLKEIEAKELARIEQDLPAVRQELLQTGCPPSEVADKLEAYRQFRTEGVADMIASIREQAQDVVAAMNGTNNATVH